VNEFKSSEPVRLVKDLPELDLRPGEVGIVRNKWQSPTVAYEVEFRYGDKPMRVLLLDSHLKAA
jgi:hypothetical protein